MYFEIYNKGKLVKRGNRILNTIAYSNELMYIPTLELVLEYEYRDYIDGHGEVKVFIDNDCFWGVVKEITEDTVNATITVRLEHIICEWEYRQLAINNAIKDGKLNFIYKSNADKVVYSQGKVDGKTYSKYLTLVVSKVQIKKSDYTSKDEDLIKLGRAKAYITDDTARTVAVHVIDKTIENKLGTYSVTFRASVSHEVGQDGDGNPIYVTETATAKVEASVSIKGGDVANQRIDEGLYTMQEKLADIYHDNNFSYPDWELTFMGEAGDETIDYVYSKQNKLEALTKTMEMTEDLFWRIGYTNGRKIEIGAFGDKKPYIISKKPTGKHNIQIIEEPTVEYMFDDVVNLATVYSDKSDGGMSTLTLRDVYNHTDEDGKIDGKYRITNPNCKFPIVILRDNIVTDVNNERAYGSTIQYYTDMLPKIAPNNIYEYAVVDIDSVKLESGKLIEGTYAFNDIGSFNTDGKKITDPQRYKAEFLAYRKIIKLLKQSRRAFEISVKTSGKPHDLNVGDKVRFIYDLSILHLEACGNYMKKLMEEDDWYYIMSYDIEYDMNGNSVCTYKLCKELRIERG